MSESAHRTPHDWDARSYDRVAPVVQDVGRALIERFELRGDEAVLDAGCGSGAVTRELRDRLPRGRLIGVDGSPTMIERARAALGPDVELHVADLGGPLPVDGPLDAIFSSAVFHWIPDHRALFRRLRALLAPGGRLLAQYGAAGNCGPVVAATLEVGAREPFAPHLGGWPGPWTFDAPEEAAAALTGAGFVDVRTEPLNLTVVTDDPREHLRSVMLGAHLERLPPELREPFVDEVLERTDDLADVPYLRVIVDARRPLAS